MSTKTSVITLLTDFGNADYFVGAMKGVILGINSNVYLVDITHEIPPQDVAEAAYVLLNSYHSFPPGTIHVAVVDPGVGSTRRAIAVSAAKQFFVGPDNGLFSYVLDRESTAEVTHLTATRYFQPSVSQTFHGRDLFAPVAAAISNGIHFDDLGERIKDPVRLSSLEPLRVETGQMEGRIIHIDRFGNCVTNFTREHLRSLKGQGALQINGSTINSFRDFYAESSDERPFAIWGSAGFLEIAKTNGSASALLNAHRGDKVTLAMERSP